MEASEKQIFEEYIKNTGLKETAQRALILDVFLNTEDHVSVEDLHRLVNDKDKKVGYATIYRTMKLVTNSGLAREVIFNDGIARFEHTHGHQHHHHLICTGCRKVIEFADHRIDECEKEILGTYGFEAQSHHYKIFGLCQDCQKKTNSE